MKGKKDEDYHPLAKVGKAKEKLTEGRKELTEALQYMNKIKTNVAKWQDDTKDFFEDVTDTYKAKVEELESSNPNEVRAVTKARAMWSALPSLIKREDPTKKRLGRILNGLVNDADKIYKGLDTKLNEYQERFDDLDTLTGDLITDSKDYRVIIEQTDKKKKELEKELSQLEEKLGKKTDKDSKYLELRQEKLEKTRLLETVSKERSSALNKYQQALNILDALESFRDENQIMLSEGRNLHETLETNLESLRPLFEQISSSADLVEFQRKALDAYDMLKKTFNPAMIAITAVSKGVSKVATERIGDRFIEQGTIDVVKQLTHEHKKELGERDKKEDEVIEEILGRKQPTKSKAVVLEQGEDGTFRAPEQEAKAEDSEKE